MNEPDPILFWEGVLVGGPILIALHVFMIVSFAFAIHLAFRRAGTVATFACSLLPFISGAFAMWVGVLGYAAIVPTFVSGLYDGDPTYGIRLAQRPFLLGFGLSAVAVLVYCLGRGRSIGSRRG